MNEKSKLKEKASQPVTAATTLRLQRKCACGSHTIAGAQCESCKQKDDVRSLQRSPKGDGVLNEVPPIVDSVLNSPGQPLSAPTRSRMQERLGHDFSNVRVHTDARAAESAGMVNAQAYTVGNDVVFGPRQFSEHSADGQKLLAHELAHVAQPTASGSHAISQPGDASEREADRAADAFAHGGNVKIGGSRSAAIQRQPKPDFNKAVETGDKILEEANPLVASALGSETLDGYDTGKSQLKPAHRTKLARVAHRIQVLMRKYTSSTVTVIGHADTVGAEGKNLDLGQERADVVKLALADLGIADSIISAESKGEGAPQAVKTKDETANASNRRVEIRFDPKGGNLGNIMPGQLKPPTTGPKGKDEYDPLPPPPIDLTYHPKITPPDPTKLPPDIWKPLPPLPKGAGPKSPLDVIGEKILDPVIDRVAGGLSKNLRDKIKEGARKAVKAGAAKGARAAAEAAGVTDPAALEAIEKATEAAIQEKGGPEK